MLASRIQGDRLSTATIITVIVKIELPQHWKCLQRKRKVRENCCMLTTLHLYFDYRSTVYGCKVYSVSSTQDIEVDHGENTEGTS